MNYFFVLDTSANKNMSKKDKHLITKLKLNISERQHVNLTTAMFSLRPSRGSLPEFFRKNIRKPIVAEFYFSTTAGSTTVGLQNELNQGGFKGISRNVSEHLSLKETLGGSFLIF